MRGDGDGWAVGPDGGRRWGRFGAAGLLLRAPLPDGTPAVLLQHRAAWSHQGGTWALPGGARDSDESPVVAAVREAEEETGIDPARVHPLVTLDKVFIAPSGFHVVPVLAYSEDPGPVTAVDPGETAIVARVPVRAFINPENRLMVYRDARSRRWAMPAFRLNQMLVWGFTAQVISAMLDVAGWAQPWDTSEVLGLDEAMALVGEEPGGTGMTGI